MSGGIFTSTVLDNESINITYASNGSTTLAEAWLFGRNDPTAQELYNNTESLSYQQNAYATLNFYGTDLEYWGNRNNDHGPCELTLDGYTVATINSYSPQLRIPTLLYAARNLTLGDHSLIIKVLDASPNPNGCEIDRFVVNATVPLISSSDNNAGSQSKSSPPAGIIAGSVIGGVALICISVMIVLLYRIRSQSRTKDSRPRYVLDKGDEGPMNLTAYSTMNNSRDYYPTTPFPPKMQAANHALPGYQAFTIPVAHTAPSSTVGDPFHR